MACLSMALSLQVARADEFIVDDIQVEGLKRITPGTVFNYLPITIGDKIDEKRSQEALRTLFKTGLFKDVRLSRKGDVLVVSLVERESIADITFEGNKAIKKDDLLKGLKGAGFAKGDVFDEAKLDRVVQELSRQYYSNGHYGSKIEPTVTPLDSSSVTVNFKIVEGFAARIQAINIVGNKSFPTSTLLREFKLTTPTWTSWFSKNDQYSKQKLAADLETLRSRYQDDGFVDFKIDSTQVSITPDKSGVYITININEGNRYNIGTVKLSGRLIIDEKLLLEKIQTRQGMLFSRKSVTQTQKDLGDRLGEEGYAFANVNAIPKINPATKTVNLTYYVDPGQRVYVRRVSFNGNAKTRDEVLRREMRQLEGGWISTKAVERSKVRLQRLGYFEDVNVETPAVAGSIDRVDVNYTVKERPSGTLSLGVGYAQTAGIIFNANVSQNNFLGSGKNVTFAFSNSDIQTLYRLGFTDPYWTIDGVSVGAFAQYSAINGTNQQITAYDSKTLSTGLNFGVPISEYNALSFGVAFEDTSINANPLYLDPQVLQFILVEGNHYNDVRLSAGYAYDTRNATIFPTDGVLQSIKLEGTVPLGDLLFYKVNYDSRYFFDLGRDYVFVLKGQAGYGAVYGNTFEFPFWENFYAGGPRTVRGYEESTLGRQDQYGRATGGNVMVIGNAELVLPVPGLREMKSVRVSAFYDVGDVWNTLYDPIKFRETRMSAGVSGIWLSPFGAISVSIAKPFNKQPTDHVQVFQFTFGTTF